MGCDAFVQGAAASRAAGGLRIGYLFVGDKSHEFDALDRGEVPAHRVFGARQLELLGHQVSRVRRAHRRPRWLPSSVDWRIAQAWWVLRSQAHLDVVLASHEAAAVPALLLRRVGLLRRPVLVMTVAVPDLCRRPTVAARLERWSLRAADGLTVFASAQRAAVATCLGVPLERVRFLPLGVDAEFFTPAAVARDGSVLAVGTNPGKDFETLVRALPEGMACTIVTDPANQQACAPHVGDKDVTFLSDVPIARLRDMYARARLVVIPLRDVGFSSGQTVLLENLAMNSPLVVSDVPGVGDYVAPGGVRLVAPGDVAAMRAALEDQLPATGAGRRQVLACFTIAQMAQRLDREVRGVLRA